MIKYLHFLLVMFLPSGQNVFSQDVVINQFDPGFFEKQEFAHRGGYAYGPENTLQTILFNLNNGLSCFEVDIQLTLDNELVIFHDPSVERILQSSSKINVSDLTLEEIKQIPLRDTSHGVQYVCSLNELIDSLAMIVPKTAGNRFIIELDFKPHGDATDRAVDQLLLILNKHLTTFGDDLYNYFYVASFYPEVLKNIRGKNKKIKTAFAVNSSPDKSKLMAKIAIILAPYIVQKYKVDIIEPNMCMVTRRFVKKWHKKNILINAYTANTECEKKYLEELGIAFVTNCPLNFCQPDQSDQMDKTKKWCKKCKNKN